MWTYLLEKEYVEGITDKHKHSLAKTFLFIDLILGENMVPKPSNEVEEAG